MNFKLILKLHQCISSFYPEFIYLSFQLTYKYFVTYSHQVFYGFLFYFVFVFPSLKEHIIYEDVYKY